jgi:hypothetical protein
MPGQTLPLKDIKPIVDVPDHSLWIFAALILAAVLAVAGIAFWLLRRRRARFDHRRALALKRLDALDFSDTKQTVYDFSLLGHFVLTPKTEATFRALLDALEPYKFRKETPPLDAALQSRMTQFIKEAHRG